MDRLLTMRVFQAVADEGGFAAAGRLLDLSATAVTRLVADLENHVGARLLQRTTRKVSLTDAGVAYLARVRHILVDVEEAFGVAQAHTSEVAGTLRLLATPVIGVHILAPVVAKFQRQYTQVNVEISVDTLHEPSIGDYDLTLLGVDASYNANVIARPIVSTEGILCASPAYVQRRGLPGEPPELGQHDCLGMRRPSVHPGAWRLLSATDPVVAVEVDVHPGLVSNHTETLLRATLEGAGISAQPLNLVAPYLCDGRLVRMLPQWITGRFTLYAALPSRKFMPARTRVFLEFLTEHTQYAIRDALEACTGLSSFAAKAAPPATR